jgi:hypothetical protein
VSPCSEERAALLGAPVRPTVYAGDTFTHHHMLDTTWTPDRSRGERYRDAPKARMRVTAVRNGRVYFTLNSAPENHGNWVTDRSAFLVEYGPEIQQEQS